MKSTVDKAGRLVVAEAICEPANLAPGTEVEFRVVADRVEIQPEALEIALDPRGKQLVAVPRQSPPPLTRSEVEETLTRLRNATAENQRRKLLLG